MKKSILLIISLVFFSANSFSQKKYELGKVTIDELKQKSDPKDSSAVAAVLFEVGETRFEFSEVKGFEIVTESNVKIKIYSKEGYSYANQSASYFTGGDSDESVSFSKAVTYNLVNDKIEKTKLGSDGEFKVVKNKNWSQRKITLPNVKEGSIIEYNVEIRSPYITSFPDWNFQKDIPVNYSEYTTYIPEYYIYNARNKGFIYPKVTEEKVNRTLTFNNKEEGRNWNSSTNVSQEKLNYLETRTKYVLENVPAMKEETYVNNIDNYTAALVHELSSKRMPNKPYENFATDWGSVVKKIYDSDNFGLELNKIGYYEKDIDALLKDVPNGAEKLGAIYFYVQSIMNWNQYDSYYCDQGVKKAYQNKTGNVAEINLMLTSMLRYAGFNANPVLVSTRSNGISLFPSRTAFNYLIVAVEFNGGIVLLDATSKNALPNVLPLNALNWFGRLIRKDGSSSEVNLMPMSNSNETIILIGEIDSQGKVSGKIRDQYFDYNAFAFREKNNNVSKESYIEKLEKSYAGMEIGDYEVINSKDLSKPIVENYSFVNNNAVEIIGDKMYFSPMMFFAQTKNPFTQEKREYPVDFIFPHQDKYNISVAIPEGYIVESLPQQKAIAMPDGMGSFKYMISNNGNKCQLLFTLDINEAIIGPENYEALKAFYKEMIDKENEKIVLKKG
jgi:hypothetical protein